MSTCEENEAVSDEQLGDAVEVEPPRPGGQLSRLLIALVGIGVVLGVIFGVGGLFFGTFSQTEAGLCRLTWAPCTELSLASVESLSGLDLPDGTEVLSGYAQELGTLHEFRAEVVLPPFGRVTMSNAYQEADGLADLPRPARDLADARYWTRTVDDPEGHDVAVTGTRADGRTVIVFDERQVPPHS
jgi:hypothetical protein